MVDLFKRPFSRRSMTPPASPASQARTTLNFVLDEALLASKGTESVVSTASDFIQSVAVAAAASSDPLQQQLDEVITPTHITDNGQCVDVITLPLPPTPVSSPATPSTTVRCTFSFCVCVLELSMVVPGHRTSKLCNFYRRCLCFC